MTVDTTVFAVPAAGSQPARFASITQPQGVLVHNETGNDPVYIGGTDVDSSNGIPIAAGATVSISTGAGSYYVAGTEDDEIRFLVTSGVDAPVTQPLYGG